MRELPILFSGDMVKAILDGQKTQTRRVVKVDKPDEWEAENNCRDSEYGANIPCYIRRKVSTEERGIYYPHYDVGDKLYVRETWKEYEKVCGQGETCHTETFLAYRADEKTDIKRPSEWYNGKWHPSIHMPKEAARIWLEVTDVRVERLQEITWEDALAEGINHEDAEDGNLCSYCKVNESHKGVRNYGNGPVYCVDSGQCDVAKLAFEDDCIDCFSELWDSIYQKQGHGWDASPWVWVIEFKRLEGYR